MEFRGKDILQQYAQEKRSVILVLGHYGNWELAGARYSQERDIPQLYVIFHPLANARFDRLMHHAHPARDQAVYHAGDR